MSAGDPLAAPSTLAPPGVPPGTRLRTLAGLASYRCGHTGSCCRAGWPIPIEAAPLAVIARAAARAEAPRSAASPWLVDGAILGCTPDACGFLALNGLASGTGGCRLERGLGHHALPYSCRQFPRVLMADGRGWHSTLSAWCGTSARLIVMPPDTSMQFLSFAHIEADPRVHVEFLDAREAWPPLLKPGVIAGLEAYDIWESRTLGEFLAPVVWGITSLPDSLITWLRWTEWIRDWRSADGALQVRLRRPHTRGAPPALANTTASAEHLLNDLMSAVPEPWRPASWPVGLTDASKDGRPVSRAEADAALARYLGTRLVGSWIAYQGEGLRSVAASLVSAYTLAIAAMRANGSGVVTIGRLTSAIRASDWLLLHLLDRADWAAWCAQTEADKDARGLLALLCGSRDAADALEWAPESPDGPHRAL